MLKNDADISVYLFLLAVIPVLMYIKLVYPYNTVS